MLSNVRGDAAYGPAPTHQQTPRADTSRLPPMGNFAPTPTANRDNKRKRGERQGPAGVAPAAAPAPMPQDVSTSNMRGAYGQGNINKVRAIFPSFFCFKVLRGTLSPSVCRLSTGLLHVQHPLSCPSTTMRFRKRIPPIFVFNQSIITYGCRWKR